MTRRHEGSGFPVWNKWQSLLLLAICGWLASGGAPAARAQVVIRVKTVDGGGVVGAAAGGTRLIGSITPHGAPDNSRMTVGTTALGAAYIPTLVGWARQSLADPIWLELVSAASREWQPASLEAPLRLASAARGFMAGWDSTSSPAPAI